ncbi:MAG: hypothetical protein ACLQNE_10070, partial [Thermoguttaceae bacterium]
LRESGAAFAERKATVIFAPILRAGKHFGGCAAKPLTAAHLPDNVRQNWGPRDPARRIGWTGTDLPDRAW